MAMPNNSGPPQGTFAVADTALVHEDALVPVPIDVLANDRGPNDLNARRVVAVDTTGTEGAVAIVPDGSAVTYVPDGQFEYLGVGEQATDTFAYTLQHRLVVKDTATVTVMVTGANDAPTAEDARFTIAENEAAQALGMVVAQDVDANDVLSFAITAGNDARLFTIDASTGEVLTTGPLDFETLPEHVLTVEVTDGNGGIAEATVRVAALDQAEADLIASVDGEIFDVNDDAVLYLSDATDDPTLHIMNIATGLDQELPSAGSLTPSYGFLSTNGAIFAARTTVLDTGLFHYANGQLEKIGELNSFLSLRSEGDYAIWSGTWVNDPDTSLLNWGLYRIELNSGDVVRVPFAPREIVNWQNDVTSDGLVTFGTMIGFSGPGDQTTDYNIFTFDDAELVRITDFSPDFSIYPRSDGELITFTREEVCCGTEFSQLVLYDGEDFEVLRETRSTETDLPVRAEPDRDYQVEEAQVAFRSASGELIIRHEDGTIEETGEVITSIIDLGPNGDVVADTRDSPVLRFADGGLLDLPDDVKGAHFTDEGWLVFTDDEIFSVPERPGSIDVPTAEPVLLAASGALGGGDALASLIDEGSSNPSIT